MGGTPTAIVGTPGSAAGSVASVDGRAGVSCAVADSGRGRHPAVWRVGTLPRAASRRAPPARRPCRPRRRPQAEPRRRPRSAECSVTIGAGDAAAAGARPRSAPAPSIRASSSWKRRPPTPWRLGSIAAIRRAAAVRRSTDGPSPGAVRRPSAAESASRSATTSWSRKAPRSRPAASRSSRTVIPATTSPSTRAPRKRSMTSPSTRPSRSRTASIDSRSGATERS